MYGCFYFHIERVNEPEHWILEGVNVASEPLRPLKSKPDASSGVPLSKTLKNTDYHLGTSINYQGCFKSTCAGARTRQESQTHQRIQQNSNPVIINHISFVWSPLSVPGYIPDRPLGGPRTSLLEPGGGET